MYHLLNGDIPLWMLPVAVVVVVLETYIENRLKSAGKWPNTGTNWYLDNLIWVVLLLAIGVPIALVVSLH